ncbi:MAG: cupin domain-containing protein [Mycobacteriaceae bacterium]|nr:cupin domain-containing protein [Mycobacteriaceae bacterium]MBV9639899.1 cupin domain-containing protein [Mycobacteriaceae bacterium]
MRPTRGVLLVTAVVIAAVTVAATASATSATGVQANELWRRSADGTDYVFRQITIAPGGSTGWHWHNGRLYGVIEEGTLTHSLADCAVDGVYPAGAGVFEPSGADHVHIGRNLGATPLVMRVLYIVPAGGALAEDAPDPGCGFS